MVRVLDLFCGPGGAAMGYHKAGFEVVGVDIKNQKHYPFEFIQTDWQNALRILPGLWEREGIEFLIHASPPCQRYSTMTKRWGREKEHPNLIAVVREELQAIEHPYVIENVVGAPLLNPILLCGSMFNLGCPPNGQLRRHRLFETSFPLVQPIIHAHTGQAVGVYGHTGGKSVRDDINFWSTDDWKIAMGINWMTGNELAQAIPPAYTEYIGKQWLESR